MDASLVQCPCIPADCILAQAGTQEKPLQHLTAELIMSSTVKPSISAQYCGSARYALPWHDRQALFISNKLLAPVPPLWVPTETADS
jgi:hypothetical protein